MTGEVRNVADNRRFEPRYHAERHRIFNMHTHTHTPPKHAMLQLCGLLPAKSRMRPPPRDGS